MFQPGGDHKDIQKTITRLREKTWSAEFDLTEFFNVHSFVDQSFFRAV